MSRYIFTTLSLISAILLAGTIVLWPWSFSIDPRVSCLSLGDDFHVAVRDGRVSFFNVKEYGPYHGSIISLGDGSEFAERRGFGDAAGIYYRYFRWADSGAVLWTLSVSLVYPVIAFAVLPGVWLWRRWRTMRRVSAGQEIPDLRRQMLTVIRLYWWMGVVGGAAYLVAACVGCVRLATGAEPPSLAALGGLAMCCVFSAFFASAVYVARRIAAKPEGMLSYARMVGIILAVVWFPLLTIPGVVCMHRVNKHLAAYCESFRGEKGAE